MGDKVLEQYDNYLDQSNNKIPATIKKNGDVEILLEENFKDYQYFVNRAMDSLKYINFDGIIYRTPSFWKPIVNFNREFKYLEIGVFQGANVFSMLKEYPNCIEIHAIDPWENHIDYLEYYESQQKNESVFLRNYGKLSKSDREKIVIYKDYSANVIPKFSNDYFDLIYIDGNHEVHAILEDAILSFQKLKNGGIMVFDDVNWVNPSGNNTNIALKAFLDTYKRQIQVIAIQNCQLFVRKKVFQKIKL